MWLYLIQGIGFGFAAASRVLARYAQPMAAR